MKFKILILVSFLILLFSCGPTYVLTHNFNYKFYYKEQVDSLKQVEGLPKSWNKYHNMPLKTETSYMQQYLYIKKTDSTEVIYTITDMDSLYRFKKKTIKQINK